MKRIAILLVPLALAGCTPTTIGSAPEAVATASQRVSIPATQALIVAHNAYQGAAAIATAAVRAGLIKGDNLDRLSALNFQAKTALDLADKGVDVARNAAAVMNLIGRIHQLARSN